MSIVSPACDLRVTLVQTDLHWHAPEDNKAMLAQKLAPLQGQTDLVVLPEMFTSGFTMQPDSLDTPTQPSVEWMQQQAQQLDCALCGSVAFRQGDKFYNRMLFVDASGLLASYDKTHLFRMAGEHNRYSAGEQRCIVNFRGWRLLLLVCYDLRFPVFCRSRNDYDAIVCVANWPAVRRAPWRTLLQARAIENLAYCMGVNRVGEDGNGLAYSGDSLLADFKGELLIDHAPGAAFIETASLQGSALAEFRDKFQAWRDADEFIMPDFP